MSRILTHAELERDVRTLRRRAGCSGADPRVIPLRELEAEVAALRGGSARGAEVRFGARRWPDWCRR